MGGVTGEKVKGLICISLFAAVFLVFPKCLLTVFGTFVAPCTKAVKNVVIIDIYKYNEGLGFRFLCFEGGWVALQSKKSLLLFAFLNTTESQVID